MVWGSRQGCVDGRRGGACTGAAGCEWASEIRGAAAQEPWWAVDGVGLQKFGRPCEQARSGFLVARLSGSVLRSIEAIRGALQACETSGVDEFFLDLAVSDPAEVDVPAEVAFG
jgi:hypothetical protein